MWIFLLVLVLLELAVIIFLLITLAKNNKAYNAIVNKGQQIVKGKLNVDDIKVEEGKGASSIIASSINAIKSNLLTFVEATKGNVIILSDAIDVLSKSVEANQKGNEQIADGVTNVAGRTAEQFEIVKDNLELIESNNEQMKKVEDSMQSIRELLDETVVNCKEGIEKLEGYEIDMNAMSVELNNINDILSAFNAEIKRIEEVGDFIIGISEQLKLLAFNASIEAARAGQAGRGFAVVADEMNDMSAKTKDGMDTINKIVREIINSSKQVNDSIRTCEDTYNKSKDTFEHVNSSFRSINQQSMDIHNMMLDVSGKFEVMADNTVETKRKATKLFDTSQAISESTHEIAAVSEEVAAESNKIAMHTEKLGGMLMGIQGLLGQFNTAIVPVVSKRSRPVKVMLMSMYDNDFWYGVGRGANYAVRELHSVNGVAEYVPLIPEPGQNLDDLVAETIDSAVARGFDGIAFPGFLNVGDAARKAIANGVKLMSYNCDCDSSIRRVACLRPDPMEPGLLAAQALAKDLNKKGNVILLMGNPDVGVNVERRDSFKKELLSYKGISITDEIIIDDAEDDVYRKTLSCLRSRDNVDALYITNGFPCAAARAVEDSGKTGKVKVYAFDHNQEIFSYIKKGIIAATIGQDAFGQGHDPMVWLYNNIAADQAFPGEFIPCRLSVVDRNNVDSLIEA